MRLERDFYSRESIETRLWQRATEISSRKQAIHSDIEGLRRFISDRTNNLDQRKKYETRVTQLEEENSMLSEEENKIEELLLKIKERGFDVSEAENFLNPSQPISKRKQRIKEEKSRLADLPPLDQEISGPQFNELGANPRALTTGRNLRSVGPKHLAGSGSLEAKEVFDYYTADTHGGKSRKGYKGSSYTSKSGKRIRKR